MLPMAAADEMTEPTTTATPFRLTGRDSVRMAPRLEPRVAS